MRGNDDPRVELVSPVGGGGGIRAHWHMQADVRETLFWFYISTRIYEEIQWLFTCFDLSLLSSFYVSTDFPITKVVVALMYCMYGTIEVKLPRETYRKLGKMHRFS